MLLFFSTGLFIPGSLTSPAPSAPPVPFFSLVPLPLAHAEYLSPPPANRMVEIRWRDSQMWCGWGGAVLRSEIGPSWALELCGLEVGEKRAATQDA